MRWRKKPNPNRPMHEKSDAIEGDNELRINEIMKATGGVPATINIGDDLYLVHVFPFSE